MSAHAVCEVLAGLDLGRNIPANTVRHVSLPRDIGTRTGGSDGEKDVPNQVEHGSECQPACDHPRFNGH